MNYIDKLEPERFYHVYNRAVGNEILFVSDSDYNMFFSKLDRFLGCFVDIYAYCLIPNHFHLLIRVKSEAELKKEFDNDIQDWNAIINQKFSNFFNSYTRTFNKFKDRKGKLFMLPYRRKQISDDIYYTQIIGYIHRNPIHHGIVNKLDEWKYSSYKLFLSDDYNNLKRNQVIDWFGGRSEFENFHDNFVEEYYHELIGS